MRNRSSVMQKFISAPYLLWSLIFIIAPLILVVYYSVTDSSGSFTFDNILALKKYSSTLFRSLWFGVVATVICLFIAYPIAYVIAQTSEKTQGLLIMLIMLPMWMNFLIRTYSWMTILENTGIINNLLNKLGIGTVQMINTPGAVITGMVYNFLPYMILPIYSVISKIDHNLIEAAQDLGSNHINVLKRVIFPLSLPGVASGITMVFVPSVSTFYISQKLGGGKFALIGDVIEMQFQTAYNYNLGAALSLVLMVLILICMAILNRFTDDEGGVLA